MISSGLLYNPQQNVTKISLISRIIWQHSQNLLQNFDNYTLWEPLFIFSPFLYNKGMTPQKTTTYQEKGERT